jgi:hypothetical protein
MAERRAVGLCFPSQGKKQAGITPSRERQRLRGQLRKAWFSSHEYKSLRRELDLRQDKIRTQKYRAAHLDEVRERGRKWAMADRNRNPEKHREYRQRFYPKDAKWRATPEIKARIKAYKRLYKTVEFQVALLLRQAAQLETALTERETP